MSWKITQICSCNKAFWRKQKDIIVYEEPCLLHLQSMTKFLPFAVIVFQNLSQLMCGHFAGTNQNGRNKQGSRKNLVTVYLTCGGLSYNL